MNTNLSVLFLTLLTGLTLQAATAEQELTTLLTKTKDVSTDAVLIYKDGQIIYQMYDNDYTPATKHLSWSMGKTISGVMIGQAIEDGLFSYDDKVKKYFPTLTSDATVLDFLKMGSGVKFTEVYSGLPVDADVTKMLYTVGPKVGYADYVTSLPARLEVPGQHYYYSSGDTNVLMGVLQKSLNDQKNYNAYPWKKFFGPIGITNVTFEQDTKGTFIGSSYIYMSAPDYLKVGKLFMQKGVWNGQQVIPATHFNLMNTVNDGAKYNSLDPNDIDAYSVQVRTNQPIPTRNLPSQFSEIPLDSLLFMGHQGQYIVTSPSQNLVIVRLGMDKTSLNPHLLFAAVKKLILEKGFSYQTAGTNGSTTLKDFKSSEERGLIEDIPKVPHLLRSYAGKEYCSCRLVVGRSDKACKTDLKATFPVLPRFKLVKNNTVVESRFGTGLADKVTRIEYRGSELGCTIIETE